MNDGVSPSALGRSLRLAAGDLSFVNGDFAAVVGPDNFLQAMQVMIETPFGSDVFNVNYGFDLLNSLALPQTAAGVKDVIRLHIVKSLSLDDRVREIKEIVFSDEPRFYELSPQADPAESLRALRAERRWEAVIVLQTTAQTEAPFQNLTAGEVALQLQGAVS